MAKEVKATELRQKSKFAAMEGLKPRRGFPVPPRKAMSTARKASKGLAYPLPPYANANPISLYRWASAEWKSLDRWQALAAPVMIIVALLTWQKELSLRDARWIQIEQKELKHLASELAEAAEREPQRRKLFSLIPLP